MGARRNELIADHQDYTHGVVRRLIRTMGLPGSLFDEFVSAGYLGLVEAADRYDESAGVTFKNFAFLRIRGAVIDSIRQCSELSGKGYRCAKALERAHSLAEEEGGVVKSDQPAEANIARILDHLAKGALAYRLDVADAEERISSLADPGATPEGSLEAKERVRALKSLVQSLPERERMIVELYYFEGLSFVEIAHKVQGLSKSWVSRLHARALTLLKEKYLESCDAME